MIRLFRDLMPVVTVALLALTSTPIVLGEEAFVVAPNDNANIEGNSRNVIPFFGNPSIFMYQQVYDSSQFSSREKFWITEVAFRADQTTPSFSQEVRIEIDFSTTQVDSRNISSSLMTNRGADVVTSYDGSLIFEAVEASVSGPQDFQVKIELDVPFEFDPGAGNLLMEVRRPAPVPPISQNVYLDYVFQTPGVGRAWKFDNVPGSGIAEIDQGLVTRFTIVPEPAAHILACFAALAWRLATTQRAR